MVCVFETEHFQGCPESWWIDQYNTIAWVDEGDPAIGSKANIQSVPVRGIPAHITFIGTTRVQARLSISVMTGFSILDS